MPQCELYAVCDARSAAAATAFLDAFLPARVEAAVDYPVPALSDSPEHTYTDVADLLAALERRGGEEYAVYWNRAGRGDPHQAMLMFTADGGMIAGLATSRPDPGALLQELAQTVRGNFAVVVLEQRPPDTLAEFRALCANATGPRIVDGVFSDG